MDQKTIIHLIAGGVGGTVGAVVTCPLDVVKTRLQSSVAMFTSPPVQQQMAMGQSPLPLSLPPTIIHTKKFGSKPTTTGRVSLLHCFRHIIHTEGYKSLFKGLGPNLVGVAPTRAIYFCAYAQTKNFLCNRFREENHLVHVLSAAAAGFAAATTTNPIWVVKTRVQLDQGTKVHGGGLSIARCIRGIYAQDGLRGFYRGVTASYFGVSETVIHFVLYESMKQQLAERRATLSSLNGDSATAAERMYLLDFFEHMLAGGTSKLCASIVTYPHEVARTRMRQEGSKYRAFFATLMTIAREEGFRALYRGLGVQLLRAIPNTAVMMSFYELTVDLLTASFASGGDDVDGLIASDLAQEDS